MFSKSASVNGISKIKLSSRESSTLAVLREENDPTKNYEWTDVQEFEKKKKINN